MRPSRPDYRMYIDEVGNPGLGHSDHPNNQYLSLTGVLLKLAYEPIIERGMNELKLKYFGSSNLVFHRSEVERGSGIFKPLLDPQTRQTFNQELLAMLKAWKFVLITVCIDKVAGYQKHTNRSYEPYHYGLAILLEHYASFLEEIRSVGDVLAEARSNTADIKLKKEFERLWQRGAKSNRLQRLLTSKHLKIKPKTNNDVGLQSADLLAYPSQQEILMTNNLPAQIVGLSPDIIHILADKYYQVNGINIGRIFVQ